MTSPAAPSTAIPFLPRALGLALLCSLWAVFGGSSSHRLPLHRVPESPAFDATTHVEIVASAGDAQAEGAWPPLEAPHIATGPYKRYPVFQFYSFLPYQVPALALRFGLGAYGAWVLTVWFGFFLGALGATALARSQGLGPLASMLCGAAYTLAPYHLTDLFGRYAYPELMAFGLLPGVFWAALRCAQRPGLGAYLFSSLLWAALLLSHNVFHVWGAPVAAVWLGLLPGEQGRLRRMLLPAAAYLTGLALGAFFFAGPLLLGPSMVMGHLGFGDPHSLNPFWVLFSPWMSRTGEVAGSSPYLGLQVGWPWLAAFIAIARKPLMGDRGAAWWLFAVLLYLVWSPINPWPWMGPFQVAQFSYRLLTFTTLFGSFLMAQWAEREGLTLRKLASVILLLFVWSLIWKRCYGGADAAAVEQTQHSQGTTFRTGLYYVMAPEARRVKYAAQDLSKGGTLKASTDPKVEVLGPSSRSVKVLSSTSGRSSEAHLNAAAAGNVVVLPLVWYPGLYQVLLDGRESPYGFVEDKLAVEVPAGEHLVKVSFTGIRWAINVSSVAALLWLLAALFWSVRTLILNFKNRYSRNL